VLAVRSSAWVVIAALSISACGGGESDCSGDFDSARWRNAPTAERYPLASEIVRCGRLEGAARPEVRQLLGGPDEASSQPARRAREWLYVLGSTEEEFGPGHERSLYMRFATSERVSDVKVDPE
jgi:hypothetical protein